MGVYRLRAMRSHEHPRPRDGETTALVATGSNLGDRAATIAAAIKALGALPRTRVLTVSPLIETDPIGPPDQGRYLNGAVLLSTALRARELLEAMLAIETGLGRVRDPARRWGPRTLDLDLILFGDGVINEPGLHVPHPRLHERVFVLIPAAQIAPDMPVPGHHASIATLLERCRLGSPA